MFVLCVCCVYVVCLLCVCYVYVLNTRIFRSYLFIHFDRDVNVLVVRKHSKCRISGLIL